MNSTIKGVAVSGPEIRALLEFGSKQETDRDKFGVQFRIAGDRVFARTTNGEVSLELDGEADGQHADGEWFVHRHFVVQGKKLITGKQVLRLQFSGASLHSAIVEENGVEICTLEVPADAAVAQASFPEVEKEVKLPAKSRTVAHCSALAGAHAELLRLAEEAVGVEYSDLYPPKDAKAHWIFVAGDGVSSTVAKGSLKPRPSAAATREEGEDSGEPEDPAGKRGRKKATRQQELAT